ncbi:GGDEF domain-containing protein [candidate division WOR-3 bacterium]|nr:GGDEF domain-containing protein [candidate division WOR-3 bacterium]
MRSASVAGKLTKLAMPLFASTDPRRICAALAKNICVLLKARASLIVLCKCDSRDKSFQPVHTYKLSPEYQRHMNKDIAVALMACEKKRITVIKDIKQLHQQAGRSILQKIRKERIASLVAIPMTDNGNTIGCINVYYARPVKRFTANETTDLFVKLGASAMLCARAARAFEEETRYIKGVGDIGNCIASSSDIDDVIGQVLKTAVNTVDADSGGLILTDEQGRSVISAHEYSKESGKARRYVSAARLDKGISGKVLYTKKPVVVTDRGIQPGISPAALKKQRITVAGIPLMARGKTIGLLFINYSAPTDIPEITLEYLSAIAHQAAVGLDNLLLSKKVKREDIETALLYDVSQRLISTLDFDDLLRNILQHLKDTFGFLNVSVLLIDEDTQALYTHSSIVYSADDRDLRLRIGIDGITGHVAETKTMYYSPDVSSDPYYIPGIASTRSEACFPLLIGERLIGTLDVESSEVDGFSQDVIRLLSSLSAQIAIAMENARLYAETKKLSLTDPLTSLSNRRSYEMFVDSEIRRAERYRRTFVIMMIDFDNFKNYNDKYGHTAGDIVLQKLSSLMKEMIRDVDFLCRYGGDEFVVILPETDASFALEIAERMRKKVAAQKIQPRITLSIGIAAFPHDARDKSKLIDLADQACFEAKQRGGNRVFFTFKPKENT